MAKLNSEEWGSYLAMKKKDFDELIASVKEAGSIMRGEKNATRISERILKMEKQGILKRPVKKAFSFHKLVRVPGKSISEAVMEERDER